MQLLGGVRNTTSLLDADQMNRRAAHRHGLKDGRAVARRNIRHKNRPTSKSSGNTPCVSFDAQTPYVRRRSR